MLNEEAQHLVVEGSFFTVSKIMFWGCIDE